MSFWWEGDMRSLCLASIGLVLGVLFSSLPSQATDYSMGSVMWQACKNPYNGDYRRMKIGNGGKAMVAGYNRRTKQGHCFWTWKQGPWEFTYQHLMNVCLAKGYQCVPVAANNRMSGAGRTLIREYKLHQQQKSQASLERQKREKQARQQQTKKQPRWTEGDQAVINGVLGVLGGMATGIHNGNNNQSRNNIRGGVGGGSSLDYCGPANCCSNNPPTCQRERTSGGTCAVCTIR